MRPGLILHDENKVMMKSLNRYSQRLISNYNLEGKRASDQNNSNEGKYKYFKRT